MGVPVVIVSTVAIRQRDDGGDSCFKKERQRLLPERHETGRIVLNMGRLFSDSIFTFLNRIATMGFDVAHVRSLASFAMPTPRVTAG